VSIPMRALGAVTAVIMTVGIGASEASAASVTSLSSQRTESAASQSNFEAPGLNAEIPDSDIMAVKDASGNIVGYAVNEPYRSDLDAIAAQLQAEGQALSGAQIQAEGRALAEGGVDTLFKVAACVGGVSLFIGLTVFPSVKAAKLAVRLGKMVKQYGVKRLAKILLRLEKGKEQDRIFIEFGKQALGIGVLAPCLA
jgi:hypothetical protein